jgi:hypothetical protein
MRFTPYLECWTLFIVLLMKNAMPCTQLSIIATARVQPAEPPRTL